MIDVALLSVIDGFLLQFMLPDNKQFQVFFPPHAVEILKSKVAAMGESSAPEKQ